jgi:glycopeptide antibiotics resistance protein
MPITLPVYDLGKNWSWLVFNLPDALWSFSFTNFLMLSSKNNSLTVRNMYLIFGVLVMLASEVAQGSFLNGTFDLLDIVAISIGVAISFFLLRSSTRKSSATI